MLRQPSCSCHFAPEDFTRKLAFGAQLTNCVNSLYAVARRKLGSNKEYSNELVCGLFLSFISWDL